MQVRYKYDSLSRLIREDNKPLNKTTTWEYDAGGNILNRFEYEFTTANDLSNLSPIVIPYAYAVTGIRDRLMEYNEKSFVYDEIGNPTLYRNNTLVWEKGRQLKSYGNIANYTYNASGIRTGKTVGTTTTQFFLDGTKILAQKDIVSAGENTTTETLMQFIYGVDGVIGFTINNESYYYKKNLQGDIIGIYDNNLQLITKYTYDAWGNHKISYLDNDIFVDFSPANSYNETNTSLYIALKNPFRYRSYYYDTETGLYYLNSRYYDPEIGRFINIDEISVIDLTKVALNGFNLYVYCLNNPINGVDEDGYILSILIGLLVAAGIGALVGGISYAAGYVLNGIFTNDWEWSWGDFLGSIIGGAIGGLLSPAGFYFGAFMGSFTTSIISDILNFTFNGTELNWGTSLANATLSGIFSMATAGIMKAFGKLYVPVMYGRGSYNQVSQQIYTKLFRGQILNIKFPTLIKMFKLELFLNTLSPIYNLFDRSEL